MEILWLSLNTCSDRSWMARATAGVTAGFVQEVRAGRAQLRRAIPQALKLPACRQELVEEAMEP